MQSDSPISQNYRLYSNLAELAGGLETLYYLARRFFIDDRALHVRNLPFRHNSYEVPQALSDVWSPDRQKDEFVKSCEGGMVSALEESLRIKPAEKVLIGRVPKNRREYLNQPNDLSRNDLPIIIEKGLYVAWQLEHPFEEEGDSYLVAAQAVDSSYASHVHTSRLALVSGDVGDFLRRIIARLETLEDEVSKPLALKDFGEVSRRVSERIQTT